MVDPFVYHSNISLFSKHFFIKIILFCTEWVFIFFATSRWVTTPQNMKQKPELMQLVELTLTQRRKWWAFSRFGELRPLTNSAKQRKQTSEQKPFLSLLIAEACSRLLTAACLRAGGKTPLQNFLGIAEQHMGPNNGVSVLVVLHPCLLINS